MDIYSIIDTMFADYKDIVIVSQLGIHINEEKGNNITDILSEISELNEGLLHGELGADKQQLIIQKLRERNDRLVNSLYIGMRRSESNKKEKSEKSEELVNSASLLNFI